MELSYERYLADEDLRAELERRAHRERAEVVHDFLARPAKFLLPHERDAEAAPA
jgi:hypothetical protein